MSRVVSKTFLANGSWTAPPGVRSVLLVGSGGGGGGGGGSSAPFYYQGGGGGAGGGGAITTSVVVPVTPGTSYAITIGSGGLRGLNGVSGSPGSQGGDSTFGSSYAFIGAEAGLGSGGTSSRPTPGGPVRGLYAAFQIYPYKFYGGGGRGSGSNVNGFYSSTNLMVQSTGFLGGSGGIAGSGGGGGGGGAGGLPSWPLEHAGTSTAYPTGGDGGILDFGQYNPPSPPPATLGKNALQAPNWRGSGGGGGGGGGGWYDNFNSTGHTRNGGDGASGTDGRITVIWME